MSTVTGIDARTGREIQVDRSKLVNTYMSEEWAEAISKALEKAAAERAASGEGPRKGVNVLLDGEYHFFSFENSGGRQLSAGELAAFQQQYADDPGMNTLWKILAEMSRMGVVDGFAAFNEYKMAQRREQFGCDPFGIVPGGASSIDTILARLDNILYQIGQDRATDAYSKQAESKRYEELKKMIRLIAGGL